MLEGLKMINKRASATAVINQIMKNANGIGTSKTQAKENSQILGQNGQAVSSKAHSIASIQNLRTVATQYINFVKDTYGNRVVKNINDSTMKEFINHKLENGVSEGTANTYISELAKVSSNLTELGINSTSRDAITAYRSELKANGHNLQKNHLNRAYSNTQSIINAMSNNSPYSLSTQLQVEIGLRVDDAINSDKWILTNNNTLKIEGSKNGLNYTTSTLSDETASRVREAINNGYWVNYGEYRESLKEAVESTQQSWNGTHGLRYNYAQEALANGASRAEISLNMGHSREEITGHYLKE